MEAGAIAAYHNRTDFLVVKVLLSDGAPNSRSLQRNKLCAGFMMQETTKS